MSLPQTAHSFSQANYFGEEGLAKRAISLQRTGHVGGCIFWNFLVRNNEVCSLVELVLPNQVLIESFCVAVIKFFCNSR